MTTATEPKKFAIDYQIEDDNGKPIGPLQHFEAETQKELLELVKNAHRSAAREMYKEKRARKLGDLITPDPDQPIQKFERKALSADERTKLAAAIKDPQTSPEAVRTIIEAELGAPIESIREGLQYSQIQQRINMAQQQTDIFLAAHADYVQCDSNQEAILKWLEKRNYAITAKNLDLAYEDLGDLIVKRAPEPPAVQTPPEPTPAPTVPAAATPVAEVSPAPPQPEAILPAATPAPAITEQPAEVLKPKQSSSGLTRDAGGTPPPIAPKTVEIPYRLLQKMNSTEYNIWRQDPKNAEIVKLMDK